MLKHTVADGYCHMSACIYVSCDSEHWGLQQLSATSYFFADCQQFTEYIAS